MKQFNLYTFVISMFFHFIFLVSIFYIKKLKDNNFKIYLSTSVFIYFFLDICIYILEYTAYKHL